MVISDKTISNLITWLPSSTPAKIFEDFKWLLEELKLEGAFSENLPYDLHLINTIDNGIKALSEKL